MQKQANTIITEIINKLAIWWPSQTRQAVAMFVQKEKPQFGLGSMKRCEL